MTAGDINSAVDALSTPPIPLVQQSAAAYDGSLGPIIDLSQAVPGYPPHQDLMDALQHYAGKTELTGYGPIEGEDVLRQAYADHLSAVYDAPIVPEETHITAGCNQAFVAAALGVAGPGDALLLVTPFYFNHDSTLSMLGIKTKTVAARAKNGFLPDPADIAEAITPNVKAVVCITPNNPTGAVYPASLLETLFDLCANKGIWLIVDETYRDFLPTGTNTPHQLIARDNWREHFIGLYSFSKSFCIPGYRLGAIMAGERMIEAIAKIMDNLQICAPRTPQHAVAACIASLASWREDNRQEIEKRSKTLISVMDKLPGWEVLSIGAYFSYVRHPYEGQSSVEIAKTLAAKKGVITLPGSFFGENQEPFLRVAFANAPSEELEILTSRLG